MSLAIGVSIGLSFVGRAGGGVSNPNTYVDYAGGDTYIDYSGNTYVDWN